MFFAFGLYANSATVDNSKSQVSWTGSKVIGSSHTGNVKVKSGQVEYKKGVPTSAKVVIDMTSITNKDVTDPKWNQKLVGHLKSDDFFSVDKHKTAQLSINKVLKASDKFYLLQGDLTIKNIKRPVKIKAEVVSDSKKEQVVKADFEFDRTKYDIKYNSGSFFSNLGDKMISDDVQVSVRLHINK